MASIFNLFPLPSEGLLIPAFSKVLLVNSAVHPATSEALTTLLKTFPAFPLYF